MEITTLLTDRPRISTVSAYWEAFFKAAAAIPTFKKRHENGLEDDFVERIMLAVTEVNGCAVCSQAHAKAALESGLSESEIKALLSGDQADLPESQSVAILYATHFADTKGHPTKEAHLRLIETYGIDTARSIMAACRIITVGNIVGIAQGCLLDRLHGKSNPESSLLNEVGILLSTLLLVPLGFIIALIAILLNQD